MVLSFGELLLRISPNVKEANEQPFSVGGAEANVATALALWKVPTSYLTALPKNFLTEQLVEYLQSFNIDTSSIYYYGSRLGIYYLHQGKDLKNAGVIYDRDYSSFSNLKPGMIDWEKVFEGITWFHFSAISPALNQSVADVCLEALKVASEKNITISVDMNYRAQLWQYGKSPSEIMPQLTEYCTLVMGNIWAANKMLDIPLDEKLIESREKEGLLAHGKLTSEAIVNRFPHCKTVANTFRFDHQKGIRYYTTLYAEGEFNYSREYIAEKIVDKVGSGDCFMAGLIYGLYQNLSTKETIAFATAAAYNKLFIFSDATNSSIEEIQKTIRANKD